MTQRNKFKAVIYAFLLVIAISLLVWFMLYNAAVSRDLQRLGDLRIIQAQLADYYAKYNTYIIPGCQPGAAVNTCGGQGARRLSLSGIVDPTNDRGYQYTFGSLNDGEYRVNFGFELGLGNLPAGGYGMTKNGIVK